MNILMVNKFLHPAGGAETYMLQLGSYLSAQGHHVEYFGMEHPDNCVGNRWGLYTSFMDFHGGNLLSKARYPLAILYSTEAKRKIRYILEQFRPDVLHINNFNYQLTPTILLAADDYRKSSGRDLRIIYTAHDYQLVCPNHLMFRPGKQQVCEKCLDGNPLHCVEGKCIHNSIPRSCLGALESLYWNKRNVYDILDVIVCPSNFVKSKLDTNPVLKPKTVFLRNFSAITPSIPKKKENYVLYFGRFSEEKGIRTLLNVCRKLPHISFVFAGSGPLEQELEGIPNVQNMGFLSREPLKELIMGARFSVCPSVCHDNCPFSVMESMMAGTPVLGSDRGGIPDLIEPHHTGWIFPANDEEALLTEIQRIWASDEPERFAAACLNVHFDTLAEYTDKLMTIYRA